MAPGDKVRITVRYDPEQAAYAALASFCAARGWNVQRGLDELVQRWYEGTLLPEARASVPAAPPADDVTLTPGAGGLATDYM